MDIYVEGVKGRAGLAFEKSGTYVEANSPELDGFEINIETVKQSMIEHGGFKEHEITIEVIRGYLVQNGYEDHEIEKMINKTAGKTITKEVRRSGGRGIVEANIFEGTWVAINLKKGGDPGSPQEELITITN
jgi:hypothetical protein